MGTLCFAFMIMVFANLLFKPPSPLFGSLENSVQSFVFTPLLDVCLNLVPVIGVKPITSLITIILMFPLKLLTMTKKLTPDSLGLKFSLKECFAINPHFYEPLNTVIVFLHIKNEKDLIRILVNVSIFNYLKMNNMIDSSPN